MNNKSRSKYYLISEKKHIVGLLHLRHESMEILQEKLNRLKSGSGYKYINIQYNTFMAYLNGEIKYHRKNK